MWTKGEGGLFTGSTSEGGKANRERSAKMHKAVKDIVRVLQNDKPTDVNVVVNPQSADDLMELAHGHTSMVDVRLLRDDKGDVYAWNAADAIHYQMVDGLGEQARQARSEITGTRPKFGEYTDIGTVQKHGVLRMPHRSAAAIQSWVPHYKDALKRT